MGASPEVQQRKWLRMLVAPGSSLGGTRPKANVMHADGSLGIKKDRAVAIVEQIKSVVAEWRKVAIRYGIPKSEQDLVEDAFRY